MSLIVLACAALACDGSGPATQERPSILLFVMDTTRMDSVSAYGFVAGTTTVTDRLAREGLLYRNAFAGAPWTLPSHATLFTGQLPSEHGVGPRHPRAEDSLLTLAERLRDEGYDTYGVSENAWISETFNLDQGFDHFKAAGREGALPQVEKWWSKRDASKPFFLFVNVIDSHAPYLVRDENRWLPDGVDAETARGVSQYPVAYMCNRGAEQRDLEILRGLYHGDVAAADEKLGHVLEQLSREVAARPVIHIVTSDHGEHFGESHLVSHQFSVRSPLLRVPLVVHGVPGVEPASVSEAVQLGDIVPSVLEWAGIAADPNLTGAALPTRGVDSRSRVLMAENDDPASGLYDGQIGLAHWLISMALRMRRKCGVHDRVHGDMKSAIAWPYKMNWYAEAEPELYDMTSDLAEVHDVAESHPDVVRDLGASIEKVLHHERTIEPTTKSDPEVSGEVYERLRELGYVGGKEDAP